MTRENAKACVAFLKQNGYPYILKISNYTTEIVSEIYNIQFMQSKRGVQCFAAAAKIKSDVKGKEKPVVDKDSLIYFNHDFKRDAFHPEVINIDLRSAYATALYNEGILSEATFEYLGRIPKLDRLASVGMLAAQKHVFHYNEKNKITKYEKIFSENENFFYFAVLIVERIMNHLRMISGHAYLFTWVDGIYVKNDPEIIAEIEAFLKEINFRYKVETLTNFEVKVTGKVKLSFEKDGKTKYFQVPAKPSLFAKDVINFLTNKNDHNNENLQTKTFKKSN